MNRYISGKPVSNINDIPQDGQDYILILDEGCFSYLEEIKKLNPVAAISDYNLIFTHIPSYMQMFSIPLYFMPENRCRKYVTYYEQTHSLADNIRSKSISVLEDVRGLEWITVDTLLSIVYSGNIESYKHQHDTSQINDIEGFKVRTSVKSKDEVGFTSVDADGVGLIFSEFLFFDSVKYPTKNEQRKVLETIINRNKNGNYTVRLFDINHDKIPKWLRGVKLGNYDHPLFERFFLPYLEEQLRCLFDLVRRQYPISILIPYVRSAEDIHYIRKCIDDVAPSYSDRIKLGAMIENVPAVKQMYRMLESVDFFSVGSNDLIHSFYDMNRTHVFDPEQMARILDDENFWSVLSDIKRAAESKPIRMGGQLPIYPEALTKLINIGYNQFTISPHLVKQMKHQIVNRHKFS